MARTPRLQVTEAQDIRRDQILEEAIKIVSERGYYGFTVQELAQRCQISNAGLLYHFGSKDQLLLEMLQEFERRATAAIVDLVKDAEREGKRGGLSAAAVLEFLHKLVAYAIKDPQIVRLNMVLQSEALNPGHPAYTVFKKRQAKALSFYVNLISPHVESPRSTARQLIAMQDGLALQWIREERGFDFLTEWKRSLAILLP